jgi:hypothetical protein
VPTLGGGADVVAGRPHDVTIRGAAVTATAAAQALAPRPAPPRVRTGGRQFALGRPGEAAAMSAGPPSWLASLPVRLAPHLIDAEAALRTVPFRPMWLLRVSQAHVTVCPLSCTAKNDEQPSAPARSADGWAQVRRYLASAVAPADWAAQWTEWLQSAARAGELPGSEGP